MTDPIADYLTRLRNAIMAHHRVVEVPASNLKKEITKILFEKGYILNYKFVEDGPQGSIKVALKYNPTTKQNAIKCLKQALAAKEDNVVVLTYLGACYNSKAGNLQDPNGRKVVYQEAIKVLDKAKLLDPEKAQANWGYTRYQAYYGYYGPNAAETKQAEAESK